MTVAALAPTLTLAEVLAGTGDTLVAGPAGAAGPVLDGVSIDSRTVRPGELFVAIQGPRFDGHDFLADAAGHGAVGALVHREVAAPPGVAVVRVADTTLALGDLARHVRQQAAIPVVGVTGSVGKTTTKDMIAALLETRGPVLRTAGNLNNHWGLPLTLLGLREEHTAAVLEMGMSAPGELRVLSSIASPDLAVITRVAAAHLEFFSSVDAIAEAKAEILEGLRPGGTAVLNGDDPRLRAVGESFDGPVVWFGRDRGFDISAERQLAGQLRSDSRLYRQAAKQSGQADVAALLEQLERVLIELANGPETIPSSDLGELRALLEEGSLLFKVRVVGSRLREEGRGTQQPVSEERTALDV